MVAFQAPPGEARAETVLVDSEDPGDRPGESVFPAAERARPPVVLPARAPSVRPARQAPVRIPETAVPSGGTEAWRTAFLPGTWPIWSLSLVGLAAILTGLSMVLVLRRQIRALSRPRLYVDSLRFTGLVAGSRPVFFVRVANAGPEDAYKVTVTMSAVYQGGGGKAGTPQTMTVPSHGSREYFVRWQNALTTAVRDDILSGSSKLCVKISIEQENGESEKHCYQYQPWDEDRPSGVPDFVPCDLDSQLGGFSSGRTSRVATEDVPLGRER
jgi:hypothetical protein